MYFCDIHYMRLRYWSILTYVTKMFPRYVNLKVFFVSNCKIADYLIKIKNFRVIVLVEKLTYCYSV
jgi:hypothetical protein